MITYSEVDNAKHLGFQSPNKIDNLLNVGNGPSL